LVTPVRTFIFLLLVGLLFYLLMLIFPAGVVVLGAYTLKLPSINKLFKKEAVNTEAVGQFLDIADAVESDTVILDKPKHKDTILKAKLAKVPLVKGGDATHPLHHFFTRLIQADKLEQNIRILHYGDSQIEGDRMTGVLRNEFQKMFGGFGPGLLPVSEFVPNFNYEIIADDNWQRIAMYGNPPAVTDHNEFGPLMAYSTFSSTGTTSRARVTYNVQKRAYGRTKNYQQAIVHLGKVTDTCIIRFKTYDSLIAEKKVLPSASYQKVGKWLGRNPESLTIEFESAAPPHVYGVSLESVKGVMVDNIAMRGSSGTVFRKTGAAHLSAAWQDMNVAMVILQFGGNAVPYINDSAAAEGFGRTFAAQVKLIKRVLPDASILIIGPSDMATLIDGEMRTFAMLPYVNETLKKVALLEKCAYFDMFEVMGGANSMQAWVAANPPLAANDYIHFSPLGARKMAEVIFAVLMNEFEWWKKDVEILP
jgi:lysophospholipase L1-like esterase